MNYHDRARADGEFAVEELRKKDRYINELHSEKKKLGDIDRYVDAAGGVDELIQLASVGNQVKSNPQLRKAYESALNGTPTEVPKQEEEDEIYDPEIRALSDKQKYRFEQQEQMIQELRQRLDKTETIGLKSSLSENIESALSRFAEDEELLEEAKSEIVTAVNRLEREATGGNRSSANQLEQLAGAQGSKTLRMMTLDIYDKFVEKRMGAKNQPDGERIRSKATDDRSTSRATLPIDKIEIKPGKVSSKMVEEVMGKLTAKRGKDPDALWR
jgi:hypothetical protein